MVVGIDILLVEGRETCLDKIYNLQKKKKKGQQRIPRKAFFSSSPFTTLFYFILLFPPPPPPPLLFKVDPSVRGSVRSLAADPWFDLTLHRQHHQEQQDGKQNKMPVTTGAAAVGGGGNVASLSEAQLDDEACAVAFMKRAVEIGQQAKQKEVRFACDWLTSYVAVVVMWWW
jgi:hypothetical protein